MSKPPITQSAFKNLKKRAKCIGKENKISYMEALDVAAQEIGYKNYRYFHIAFTRKAKFVVTEEYANDVLTDIIQSAYSKKIFGEAIRMFPGIRSPEKFFWDAFLKGIQPDGRFHSGHYKIFAYGMDKESLKKEGYLLISEDRLENRITGYLVIAIAHFFRSIAACIADQREDHSPFNTYMSDWIDSCNLIPEEDEAYITLVKAFPINDNVRMVSGSTTWGSLSGGNYEGRKPLKGT